MKRTTWGNLAGFEVHSLFRGYNTAETQTDIVHEVKITTGVFPTLERRRTIKSGG